MLEALFSEAVSTDERRDDQLEVSLFPEEHEVIASAVFARRSEFTTVRGCARRSLERLGYPPSPILPGVGRCPVWPVGIVGTMTHCAGFRAAAIALAATHTSIGLDCEPNDPLPAETWGTVLRPVEQAQARALKRSHPQICWDRLTFCAKEAAYKAWFPMTHRWLDFDEVTIHLSAAEMRFGIELVISDPHPASGLLGMIDGRCAFADGILGASVEVPARI